MVGALDVADLVLAEQYDIDAIELPPGDENVQGVHLQTSVHLYSGVYDFIYVSIFVIRGNRLECCGGFSKYSMFFFLHCP